MDSPGREGGYPEDERSVNAPVSPTRILYAGDSEDRYIMFLKKAAIHFAILGVIVAHLIVLAYIGFGPSDIHEIIDNPTNPLEMISILLGITAYAHFVMGVFTLCKITIIKFVIDMVRYFFIVCL